ncbi:DUF1456 family protein [Ketobacter sp. MCCC 1A13808]|uniref:DUF1456 family protein n=1 Tax=Ketobacter sp. MCCC 1A13808 TaxID=2602738 RepID=UPI000F16C595|nr:DUF1456 family protein [Ketobacter sp. MCCC 1A13808]MVF11932.1 DUF1456 family protein [Ketobacter sp. MCCC 1A13808]RLP52878.1 MAG: DUF1456 family protein [Ketobacter sp.]
MNNNELLRNLRRALAANENTMADIYAKSGRAISPDEMKQRLKHANEDGFAQCDDETAACFLEALIVHRRGPKPDQPPAELKLPLNNNLILKKLRIAFDLKEDDLRGILASVDVELSKQELNALFRRQDHKNFQPCDEGLLRGFLRGLVERERVKSSAPNTD